MPHPFSLRFRYGVRTERLSDEKIRIILGDLECERPITPESSRLFELLSTPGISSSPEILARAPFGAWTQFAIPQLEALGLLQYELLEAGQTVMTLEPAARKWRLRWRPLPEDAPVKASRFAALRMERGRCFVETPLAPVRVVFGTPESCALWTSLATPMSAAEFPTDGAARRLELLVCAGVADIVNDDGELPEETDRCLQLWSHHELLFHARSRIGRHDLPYGAWFLLSDRIPEPPSRRPVFASPAIPLAASTSRPRVMSVFEAIDARHSARTWDDENPLSIEQLGEFLYLSSRTKGTAFSSMEGQKVPYEHIYKPSPSGGSMGELEVYIVADRCAGLDAGVYHYESHTHALHLVSPDNAGRQMLLRGVQTSLHSKTAPQVLLVVTARHPRVLWKYSSMGYALALKDLGVLFQSWYLLATALGIGACAAGMGDADLFAATTGLQYFEESSVGEFALGSIL